MLSTWFENDLPRKLLTVSINRQEILHNSEEDLKSVTSRKYTLLDCCIVSGRSFFQNINRL